MHFHSAMLASLIALLITACATGQPTEALIKPTNQSVTQVKKEHLRSAMGRM